METAVPGLLKCGHPHTGSAIMQCFSSFWKRDIGLTHSQLHRVAVDNGSNMIAGLRDLLIDEMDATAEAGEELVNDTL